MPQIWPMNWVLLFMFFSIIFLVFLVNTYFFKTSAPTFSSIISPVSPFITLDWKW